ncbi:MAG: FAD-binding oxidoreductase [Spirochaetota bacterium]
MRGGVPGRSHRVVELRRLTESTIAIHLERLGMRFEPGQYVNIGFPGEMYMREYSIYSAPGDEHLEVLVRVVDGGLLSPKLARVTPGTELQVDGPFGSFTIPEHARDGRFIFVSTGTGIAPFRSFVRAYPALDYVLVHGARRLDERYDWKEYAPDRRIACISREAGGDLSGRTTDWLRRRLLDVQDGSEPTGPDTRYYLCGNCDMIYEAVDVLRAACVSGDKVSSEVYF